jgi:Na+/H+-dicarboxylate symporter
MMRGFIQAVCVLAIALGSGLVAFGSKLEPQFNVADPAALVQFLNSYQRGDEHLIASLTSGVGMGFLILGTLGLIVPWVNKLGNTITKELGDNSARTISTIALWLAMATILTFGVFRTHWTGGTGMSVLLILVLVLCVAAVITTAMIYGWKPWTRKGGMIEGGQQPTA